MDTLDQFADKIKSGSSPQTSFLEVSGKKNVVNKISPEARYLNNKNNASILIRKYKLTDERLFEELDWALKACKDDKNFKEHIKYVYLLLRVREMADSLYNSTDTRMEIILNLIKTNKFDEKEATRIIEGIAASE